MLTSSLISCDQKQLPDRVLTAMLIRIPLGVSTIKERGSRFFATPLFLTQMSIPILLLQPLQLQERSKE